ncbi:MAG: hypothetical protein WKF96_18230 [Solirubrobacteraceae bacterium]
MNRPLVFRDLDGPDRVPDSAEIAWLDEHVVTLDPSRFVVGLPSAHALADDEEAPPLVTRNRDGTYTAGRFIGELCIGDRALRIEPRLGFPTLAAWMAAALNVPVLPKTAGLRADAALIPQLLAIIWTALVADAARHARPAFRSEVRNAGPHVRGRLEVRGTVALRARGIADKAVSVDRPKTLRHDISRVLVRADRVLDRALRETRTEWRPRQVRELIGELRHAVGNHPDLPPERALARVRYTPITIGYRRAARLSHTIARREGLLSSAAEQTVSGALIDVAEIWELFLVHCAKHAFGATRVEHAARTADRRHVLTSAATGRALGRIRPDIVVHDEDGRVKLVLDAKYKRLVANKHRPGAVTRADLYQLTTYMATTPAGALGALLYPPDDDHPDPAIAEAEGPWHTESKATLEFKRLSRDRRQVIDSMKELANAAAQSFGSIHAS